MAEPINRVAESAVGPRRQWRIRGRLTRCAGIDELAFIPDDPATPEAALSTGRLLAEATDSAVRQSVLALTSEVCAVPAPHIGRRHHGPRHQSARCKD